MQVDFSTYNNKWYKPGGAVKRFLWHYINLVFFKSGLFPIYGLKVFLLKLFGAVVGKNVFIKPFVNIKYPWFLSIGNQVWIGEDVWIDNLTDVHIGNNVCISQGAMLITGSHNYRTSNFGLLMKPIKIENGVWICAKAIVCGGVVCGSHAVITAGTVVTQNCEAYGMYRGNPAKFFNHRSII